MGPRLHTSLSPPQISLLQCCCIWMGCDWLRELHQLPHRQTFKSFFSTNKLKQERSYYIIYVAPSKCTPTRERKRFSYIKKTKVLTIITHSVLCCLHSVGFPFFFSLYLQTSDVGFISFVLLLCCGFLNTARPITAASSQVCTAWKPKSHSDWAPSPFASCALLFFPLPHCPLHESILFITQIKFQLTICT